jgi:hypothetical protein
MMKYFSVLFSILLVCCFAEFGSAQSDHFGLVDRIYADSVTASPGQQVPVKFMLTNDELVSGASIPITYNPAILQLKSLSFSGSRGAYLSTKFVTPSDISQANGHFVVALLKISENPIPAGDGLLFTATFAVAANAPLGTVAIIDSLFYPPGGELLLTENSTADGIQPSYKAGKIVVTQPNRAPQFTAIPTQYVLEGDSLKLAISANDADGDALTLASPTKPAGSTFTTTLPGQAKFTWVPDYVGPLSSDGGPFTVTFWASDGKTSTEQNVLVQVLNRNRRPELSAPASLSVTAGQNIAFDVTALDPDFESVTWKTVGCPTGATCDLQNPAHFSWNAPLTDSGLVSMNFIASDPQGAADTATVSVRVIPATLYTMTIDTISVNLGSQASLDILLNSQLPVGSFNLLVNYDPSVMALTNVVKTGTRASYFESFVYTPNVGGTPGNVRIVGLASLTGVPASALPAGSGAIATLNFQTTSDLAYSGIALPVHFVFQDIGTLNDNTMTTEAGVKIPQTAIQYANGYVKMKEIGTIKIGDINLNGVAFEIADAIYFTNHFVDPGRNPFDLLQYANSDVNHDGLVATISDLVRLISILLTGSNPGKVAATRPYTAEITDQADQTAATISYRSDFEVGALLATIQTTDNIDVDQITAGSPHMTVQAMRDGNDIRILVYSLDGATLPSGDNVAITIPGLEHYDVTSMEMASADGEPVTVTRKSLGLVPEDFQLAQNYPNPFNPETKIEFSLPAAGMVTLTVYDALGRTVTTLVSDQLEAGHHSVTWRGTNERGEAVASGVYFYRLQTNSGSVSRKMMLLK